MYALKSKTDEACVFTRVQCLADERYSTGRLLATPLLSTPDRTQRPDYYNTVKEPISLEIIEVSPSRPPGHALTTSQGRASSRYYTSPRAFDQDLLHLFAVAKIFIRPDNPGNAWRDLLLLQVLFPFLLNDADGLVSALLPGTHEARLHRSSPADASCCAGPSASV